MKNSGNSNFECSQAWKFRDCPQNSFVDGGLHPKYICEKHCTVCSEKIAAFGKNQIHHVILRQRNRISQISDIACNAARNGVEGE